MNQQWQSFLESAGARIDDGVARFDPGALTPCNLFDLSHLGLIRVRGEDSVTFLQGQLTNDVRKLDAAHSQLSGFCSPKGRMLASFRLFRIGDDILLQLPRSRVAPMTQRLRMFVLRSKATVDDVSDELAQFALAGDCAPGLLGDLARGAPDEVAQGDGFACVRLAGEQPRFLVVGAPDALSSLWRKAADLAAPANTEAWRLLDIRAGLPAVQEQTVEAFVPQMTNLHLVNGISFTKGCYTGQEVVARMQYLGKLKRRMYRVKLEGGDCPAPGTALFAPGSESGQGAGRIVDAAPSPDGGCEALAVVETSAADSGEVRIGDAQGALLQFLELPYGFESGESDSRS